MTTIKLTIQQQQISPTRVEIVNGIDFILSHLEEPIIFPRKISTYKSNNKQFLVRSKQEVIDSFIESNFVDCRINAYPLLKDGYYTTTWTPNILFIDLDQSSFKSFNALKTSLNKTLENIKDKLSSSNDNEENLAHPTVMWSGNGYHIIQPIECSMGLENIQQFQKFEKPSQQFLRFAKDYLSRGKADKSNYPSFRSCLLRIPNSFNGKCLSKDETLENSRVKIIHRWNGYRPLLVASEILYDFQTHLIQKKIDEAKQKRQKTILLKKLKRQYNNEITTNNKNYYKWIDTKILANSFEDCRKIIVDLILAPYLINIKKMSYDESYQIIKEWLDKCNSLEKLDNYQNFVNYRIHSALKTATQKGIGPMSFYKIKNDRRYSNNLYLLLLQKGKREGGL